MARPGCSVPPASTTPVMMMVPGPDGAVDATWKYSVRADRAGAQTLNEAEDDERQHAPGEAAHRRAHDEQRRSGEEHALAAIDVGQPAIDRRARGLCQQIGGEDPAEEMEAAEIADDGRHGSADDRRFERF